MKCAGGNRELRTVNISVESRVHMAPSDALPCRRPRMKVVRSLWKPLGEMLWADFTWYLQFWRTATSILIVALLITSHADRIMHWDGNLCIMDISAERHEGFKNVVVLVGNRLA
jgi:hypothetical protein